jgi:glyoxylase-like metal-dependent hydrolase (beta-lactamase superfamily II)
LPQEIKTIKLALPLRLGSVNCYLIENNHGFILIDTGASNQRNELENELVSAGCQPGELKLIVLTHGDFDHIGNAAYLRKNFATKIAMHKGDIGMAQHGDMFWNRKSSNTLIRMLAPFLFKFPESDRFKPDFHIDESYDFSEYGFDAQVLYIPGHSKGSIGILTASGDLLCGDLLANTDKPSFNSIMDDPVTAHASLEKLKSLGISTVYPGHGKPCSMEEFLESQRANN